jgi:hypothetical protein
LYDGITDQILCSKLTCDENDFSNTSEKKWIKCVSYNPSHCIEVAQGDIFMEQKMRSVLVLGRLAIMEKNGPIISKF